jgi:hypothetical protein
MRPPLQVRAKQIARKVVRKLRQPKIVRREQIIVVDDQDRCENPVFLIGVHRSGTTLLRLIVDSHSNIACPPETFFLTGYARFFEIDRFRHGLETMGFDRQSAAAGIRRAAAHFYEAYRHAKGKPRWADKTPEYVRILPFIEEIFGPSCQYVMIYRHPFDVMSSLLTSGWDFDGSEEWKCLDYEGDLFENFAYYHRDVMQGQLSFSEAHADRCHALRYEDLMHDPEASLRRMFEFLGEPWEDAVLEYASTDHDWGTGDPTAKVGRGFRASVGNWGWWSAEQIDTASRILAPVLETLGYSADRGRIGKAS